MKKNKKKRDERSQGSERIYADLGEIINRVWRVGKFVLIIAGPIIWGYVNSKMGKRNSGD